MSLLKVLAQYDQDREQYIRELETKLDEERARNAQLTNLLSAQVAASERKTLELIMAGHFDKFVNKEKKANGDAP